MTHWLLTWTTYGTWLPGDPRGSVTRIREGTVSGGPRVEHDQLGKPFVPHIAGLVRSSQDRMLGAPVWLTQEQGKIVLTDLQSSAAFRNWPLHAAAVMANHVHIALDAPNDVISDDLLRVLKSYASRRLNEEFGKPKSGTWWTQSGSRRKLRDAVALRGAVAYIRKQHRPLAMFIASGISNPS